MIKFKNLRWAILFLFSMGVVLNYITRNSLGILAPELKQVFNISTQEYSWIVAAFQLAYTIFQPLCGWVIDYIGVKIGFLCFAVAWSLVCMLHPLASSWVSLAVMRFLMGATESSALPSSVKLVTSWFPARERGVAAGWANVGFAVGGMVAPPLVVMLDINYGWQAAFFVTGFMGLVWAIFWKLFYHEPRQHPSLTDKEKEYIYDSESTGDYHKTETSFFKNVGNILKIKKFYGIAIPAFFSEPAWQTFSFFVPLYLATERGMNIKEIALFGWLPFLAADIGSALSGYLANWYKNTFKYTRNNATILSAISGSILMVSLAIVPFVANPYTVIALISLGGFGHQLISSMISALVMENFDSTQVASVTGLRGFSAWSSGFLFSLLFGIVVPKSGYTPLFVGMGFFDIIGCGFMVYFLYNKGRTLINNSSLKG